VLRALKNGFDTGGDVLYNFSDKASEEEPGCGNESRDFGGGHTERDEGCRDCLGYLDGQDNELNGKVDFWCETDGSKYHQRLTDQGGGLGIFVQVPSGPPGHPAGLIKPCSTGVKYRG
jgi:hypothetical protein